MTRHPALRPSPGFTLVELLVALATLGILLAMLVQVTGQVATNTQALSGRMENTSEAARLRRLLHRDLASAKPGSFAVTHAGFTMVTSHNLLLGQPLPLDVDWEFTGGAVRRIERLDKQGYSRELVLTAGLANWKAEIYSPLSSRWVDLRDMVTGDGASEARGLRLTLGLPGGAVEMTERLPESAE
jgi:prepilin-type N-terminal cleavage/methylation domain-containing protein